jgi:hypothetical protein
LWETSLLPMQTKQSQQRVADVNHDGSKGCCKP